jgi:23S rRNA (cytidine2498-2'-O)-methyltransferase
VTSSEFIFITCQKGAESALKREVARARPQWRSAFQRPGLVTFRAAAPVSVDERLSFVLARVAGLSLGTVDGAAALAERIRSLPTPMRLHVFERELYRPDEAPPVHIEGAVAAQVEAAIREQLSASLHTATEAKLRDLVIDVVVSGSDPWLVGLHRHTAERSPHPGGRYAYDVPDNSPSRAYRKIEEAIAAFAIPMRAGDMALELGAAPGGAAYALARRGVNVIAVDPADMSADVLVYAGPGGATVKHVQQPMAEVSRTQLPGEVQWLLMDVHLAPQVALRAVSRFAAMYKKTLLGVVLTLKLNDWAFMDALPRFLDSARAMGVTEPRARQLPAHRQEIVLAGLTRLGAARRR